MDFLVKVANFRYPLAEWRDEVFFLVLSQCKKHMFEGTVTESWNDLCVRRAFKYAAVSQTL